MPIRQIRILRVCLKCFYGLDKEVDGEYKMYSKGIKRVFDFIIGLIALPFVLVITVVMAPIIYFNDKGPIFYNASRLGKDGKPFKMYKFRSMMVNAPDIRNEDGSTYNGDDDPRVTKVGKFMRKTSIDEVPQFLNVLLGDSGIIGTTKKNLDFTRVSLA